MFKYCNRRNHTYISISQYILVPGRKTFKIAKKVSDILFYKEFWSFLSTSFNQNTSRFYLNEFRLLGIELRNIFHIIYYN